MVSSKLSGTTDQVQQELQQLSLSGRAIDLMRGESELPVSDVFSRLLKEHDRYVNFSEVVPPEGLLNLRQLIADDLEHEYKKHYDPEREISISVNAIQSIASIMMAFVKEEDEVIIFEPASENYGALVKLSGGTPVYIELKYPDFEIDWTEVTRSVSARTRMIIVNSPHNPTGKVFSEDDLSKLAKLVTGSNIIILSDEIYRKVSLAGYRHQSVVSYPELAKRAFFVDSLNKSYFCHQWKLGYCAAPARLMSEYRKIQRLSIQGANKSLQYLYAQLMIEDKHHTGSSYYQGRYEFFGNLMSSSSFGLLPSEATYFQLLDYSGISDINDVDFAKKLIEGYGVALMPLSLYYHRKTDNKLLRACFAKTDRTLERAANILASV